MVGWDFDEDGEFWIARNHWGTAWGEHGLFRIRMHRDNLGIESDCSWAEVESAARQVRHDHWGGPLYTPWLAKPPLTRRHHLQVS